MERALKCFTVQADLVILLLSIAVTGRGRPIMARIWTVHEVGVDP